MPSELERLEARLAQLQDLAGDREVRRQRWEDVERLALEQLPEPVVGPFLHDYCAVLNRQTQERMFARVGLMPTWENAGPASGWILDWATADLRVRPQRRHDRRHVDPAGNGSPRQIVFRTSTWVWQKTGVWPGYSRWDSRLTGHKRLRAPDVTLLEAVLAWARFPERAVGLERIVQWVKTLKRSVRVVERADPKGADVLRDQALPQTFVCRSWGPESIRLPIGQKAFAGSLPLPIVLVEEPPLPRAEIGSQGDQGWEQGSS